MTNAVLVARAYAFAAERHTDQRRKGHRNEPYINHLLEVAALVAEATDGADPNLMAAAVLHDTVEDTETGFAELERLFNRDVADLVAEVSDDKSLPKEMRKALQIENTPAKSTRAKMIKIADKISNLRALVASPPDTWTEDRKAEYLAWARRVVSGARGAHGGLEQIFDEAAQALENQLKMARAPSAG